MKSQVYFIPARVKEGPESLSEKARRVYIATGLNEKLKEDDFLALKIHFGENRNSGYIKPHWLQGIIGEALKKTLRTFLTDSNTLYFGQRSNSVDHIRLAWSHGFTPDVIRVPVIIADGLIGRDAQDLKGSHSKIGSARIASAFLNSDALLCLTHVTGHIQTGIAASIKNMGMGCASRTGKLDQHSVVHPRVNPKQCRNCSLCLDCCPTHAIIQAEGHVFIDDKKCIGCGECLVVCRIGAIKMRWDEDAERLQKKIAEYALTIQSHFKEKVGFVNFLLQITKDCDCMAKTQRPIVDDIGILASTDPVAIDKAAADLVISRSSGKDVFRSGYDVDWSVQLSYGQKIGLGTMPYNLIELG